MVFTVEPGLYFKPDDLAVPEELRGIGVRIEDDILITADGDENLSAALPRQPDASRPGWRTCCAEPLRPVPGRRQPGTRRVYTGSSRCQAGSLRSGFSVSGSPLGPVAASGLASGPDLWREASGRPAWRP